LHDVKVTVIAYQVVKKISRERRRIENIFQSIFKLRDEVWVFIAGDVFQPVFAGWFGNDSALSDRRYGYAYQVQRPQILNLGNLLPAPVVC